MTRIQIQIARLVLFLVTYICICEDGYSQYKLPFPLGAQVYCTQGNNFSYSHFGVAAYAYDLQYVGGGYGLPILACRSGFVTVVTENFQDASCMSNASCSNQCKGSANRIVIEHADGTRMSYLHIRQYSSRVRVGQFVLQGQIVANEGESGCTSGPHVHLHLMNSGASTQWYSQSIQFDFDDISSNGGVATTGGSYSSSNVGYGNLNQDLPIYGGSTNNPKDLDLYIERSSISANFNPNMLAGIKIYEGAIPYNIPLNRLVLSSQDTVDGKIWTHLKIALQSIDIPNLLNSHDYRMISIELNDNGTPRKFLNRSLYFMDPYQTTTTFVDLGTVSDWAEGYVRKGASLGLFRGTSLSTFSPSVSLSREQAAKVLITTAVRLRLCNIDASTANGTFADVSQHSEYFPYIQTMRNKAYCAAGANFNPSNAVNIGEFCRFLELVFYVQPSDYSPTQFQNYIQRKIIPSYPGNPTLEAAMAKILRLVDFREETAGFWRTENIWDFHDFSSVNSPINSPITVLGTKPLNRATMAKVLTNIALYKANKLGIPLQRVAMTAPDINDMVALGEKYDNSTTPTGSAPSSIQQSYNVASGGSITLQYNSDYDSQGNPMHFYWSMEKQGATLVSNTATHRSVTFTAPVVTTPTDWHLYAYNANNRGKSNEVLITIQVGGSQGSSNAPPSQQAYSLNVGGATTSSLTATWTRGNGQFCMVTCTDDNYNPDQPVNGITYVGNSNYNTAPLTDPGDDSRVVYAGTGNSVTVTGLQSNRAYRFNVYEYNVATGNYALYNYWSVPSVAGNTLGNNLPLSSDFTYPSPVFAGQTITFTSIAQNHSSLTWSVSSGATIIGSNSASLCDISFPTPGSYQVDLLANSATAGQQITESKIITVNPQSLVTADLYVQSMAVSTPQYVSGQPLTITCSVNNGGVGTDVTSTITYILSSDTILDENTDWFMGQQSYNVLAGQAVLVSHLANNIPNNLSGQYYILAKADYIYQTPNGAIVESNENNNIGKYPLWIVQALPDFVALSLAVSPTTVSSGALLSATATYQNIGQGNSTSGPWPMATLLLSTDNQLSPDDLEFGSVFINNGNISCGGCPSVSATANNIRLPYTVTDGNYFLITAIDFSFAGIGYGFNWNVETSESNNWVATPLTVSSPNQPTIQASNVAITTIDSSSMRLTWTRGNGSGCIVLAVATATNSSPSLPKDGFSYLGNGNFGQAPGIIDIYGSSDPYTKVVYDGSGVFVDVTGLNPGESYSFYVLEYGGNGTSRDYVQVVPYAVAGHTLSSFSPSGWVQTFGYPSSSSFVYDVHFFDSQTGCMLTKYDPQFARTVDGGRTWKLDNQHFEVGSSRFPSSSSWIGSTGWLLEYYGAVVHKTTDAGISWQASSIPLNRYGTDIMFRNTNDGYLSCDAATNGGVNDGALFSTSNGGASWTIVKMFSKPVNCVYFFDSQNGWVGSQDDNGPIIFRTTDAGANWTATPIDRQNIGGGWRIRDIYFKSSQIGFAASGKNYLLMTTNGGASWSVIHNVNFPQSGGESSTKIEFLNASVGYVKWANNYLSKTLDGGISWTTDGRIQTLGYNASVAGLSVVDANTIFACGMGGLYKTTTSGYSNAIALHSAQSSYCAGSPVDVSYTITGTFDVSNIFTVQLSDSFGSFANPTDLQTFTNVGNGTLAAILPSVIQGGPGYRIRLTASNPILISDTTPAFAILSAPIVGVAVAADSLVICENENVTFVASPTNGGTAPFYAWKLNGSIVGGNSNQYSNSTLQDGDVIWVEMTSNATCANATPVVSTPLEIQVTTVDVPFIQAIDSLLAASTDVGVQWYLNGQPITGATSQFYTASQSGFYQVGVTVQGCTAESPLFAYTHIPTGSDPEQEELQNVTVFPNPTSGGFTIKIGSKPLVGARVMVYNALQVPVYDAPLVGNVAEIELGNHPSGAYFVRITTPKGHVTKTLVKL